MRRSKWTTRKWAAAPRPRIESPTSYDLMRSLVKELGGTVSRVVVSNVSNETFYAKVVMSTDSRQVEVDSRPSDAIALALRARAPIFVEEKVIDHAKTADLAPEKGETERLQKWLESLDPEDMGKYKM